MLAPYRVEPYSDFSDPAAKVAYELALAGVEGQLGKHAPLVIGGEEIATDAVIDSVNPSSPEQIVGTASSATSELAVQALDAAWGRVPRAGQGRPPRSGRASSTRSATSSPNASTSSPHGRPTRRARTGRKPRPMSPRRSTSAGITPIRPLAMAEPVPVGEYPGESNWSFLRPIGAGAAIPPWNFPLAILIGMTVGPVAAGNTVVLKPASNTPLIGAGFMEVVAEAGVPPGVINYLPGPGAEIGDTLVDHPRTRFINFTGSKEVGLRIAERAAVVHDGQKWVKRAYMEMGGKDGLIVDETADLDAAADAVVRSAYGFQGQKCSACSRLIAVDEIHDALLDRVVAKARELEVGPAAENRTVGPVVSASQQRSILSEIDRGRSEGKLVLGGMPSIATAATTSSRRSSWMLPRTLDSPSTKSSDRCYP